MRISLKGLATTLSVVALSSISINLAQSNPPTRITLWHIATEGDSFSAVLPVAIEEFNASRSDFQFVAQAIDNDSFKTQIQIAAAAGNQPDVFQTWGGGTLKAFVDAGIVRDIPQLQNSDIFLPGALSPSTFDGKHYAVPANLGAVVLWVNKALFEQYSVELPTTWTKFIEACKAFSASGIIPMAMGNRDRWPGGHWISYVITRVGGPDAFAQAVARERSFADEVFVRAGELIQEAVNAGCFERGFNGISNDDAQATMGLGLAAMRLMGDWDLAGLRQTNEELVNSNFIVMHFPFVEDGAGSPTDMIGGTGQALAISSKAPEGTEQAVIDLLSSPRFAELVVTNGFLPALQGYDDDIQDPIVQQIAVLLSEATFIQLYYDQFLPPALAEAHLNTTQALFGLSMTPQVAAETMEALAVTELGPVKQ